MTMELSTIESGPNSVMCSSSFCVTRIYWVRMSGGCGEDEVRIMRWREDDEDEVRMR